MIPPYPTLEEFRNINNQALIEKGIEPPKPDSEVELKMYEQWIQGRNKINQLIKKNHEPRG